MSRKLIYQFKNLTFPKNFTTSQRRCSSYSDIVFRKNALFELEQKRQFDNVGRIEKIEVKYVGVPKDATLSMNKNISTPYDCARHLSAFHGERSALALIDGTNYWDMHRPLTQDCTLELLHFMIADPVQVNKAYWRTCSFLLGAVISTAFKDNVQIKLHSFPSPDIRSGSFVYDAHLVGLDDWKPNIRELKTLSVEMVKRSQTAQKLERLTISKELALEMFSDNEFKSAQIPDIAKKNDGKVVIYRAGDHIDISKGPMIGNLKQMGRITVAAVHQLHCEKTNQTLHRFQGVSLPVGIIINHMAYKILEERAMKLNGARSPFSDFEDNRISAHALA